MEINITKKDIEQGQPENIKCCPIALALRRTFKTDMVEVKKDDATNQVSFVNEYDRGQTVEPFTFKINL